MTTTFKRGLAAFTALVLLALGTVVSATPAGGATTQPPPIPELTNIRTGLNVGYDRVVLDLSNGLRPDVSYSFVGDLYYDALGEIFWLTGEHFVSVVVSPANAHTEYGYPTYTGPQRFRTYNLRNVMAVGLTGDFEAHVSIGLGIRYQSWVRVFTLTAPNRVVIDVGH